MLWLAATVPTACFFEYRHLLDLSGARSGAWVQMFFIGMAMPGFALTIISLNRLRWRNPALVFMFLLSLTLLCRELHFVGTHRGV